MAARLSRKQQVAVSTTAFGSSFARLAQVAEHTVGIGEVASSIDAAGSKCVLGRELRHSPSKRNKVGGIPTGRSIFVDPGLPIRHNEPVTLVRLDTAPDSKRKERGKMTHAECAMLSLPALIESNRKRKEAFRAAYEVDPKKCLGCGVKIPYEKRRHRFCGHSCAAVNSNIGVARHGKRNIWTGEIRPCENCGSPTANANAKYCRQKCVVDKRYQEFLVAWKSGKHSGLRGTDATCAYLVRYLREKYGNKCSQCGWGEVNQYTGNVPVQVHHKDGRYENMREDNLDLLCPNCHSLTPTHGGRNKGRGRPGRKAWREKNRVSRV